MKAAVESKTVSLSSQSVSLSVASKLADFLSLTKIKLSSLVSITSALGYWLAWRTQGQPWSTSNFLLTTLGVLFLAFSANAFNQVIERDFDALMERTKNRPLPSGKMKLGEAVTIGVIIGVIGVVLLLLATNPLTSLLAIFAWMIYLLAYAPLKRLTFLCTAVGAISGALPPVIGWTAVKGSIGLEAVILFCLQFLWQFPHFWSIAWIYRDDYAKAGFKVLPPTTPNAFNNLICAFVALVFAVSLVPALINSFTGWLYLVAVVPLGVWLLKVTFNFGVAPSRSTARALLVSSDIYLPLVLLAWIFTT